MAEKPIECSNCQRPVYVTYKEISQEATLCSEMCSDCPILARKLHGCSNVPLKTSPAPKLCCALCMTTAEAIQTGNPLGCNHCYTVFEELLLEKLAVENLLSSSTQAELQSGSPLHRGKSPEEALSIPLSNELSTLTVALNDALQKEHYEQAAWLRDQIKELKEQASDRKKPSS